MRKVYLLLILIVLVMMGAFGVEAVPQEEMIVISSVEAVVVPQEKTTVLTQQLEPLQFNMKSNETILAVVFNKKDKDDDIEPANQNSLRGGLIRVTRTARVTKLLLI